MSIVPAENPMETNPHAAWRMAVAQWAADAYTESGTVPSDATPDDVARTQQQLRILQWATPVLTGALIVLGAQQGEQQRPQERFRGWLKNAS